MATLGGRGAEGQLSLQICNPHHSLLSQNRHRAASFRKTNARRGYSSFTTRRNICVMGLFLRGYSAPEERRSQQLRFEEFPATKLLVAIDWQQIMPGSAQFFINLF
jgi:hypothetical protein